MKLLSFDIEISDVFDLKDGEDMNQYAPFHISVASTVIHEGKTRLWYSKGANGDPTPQTQMEAEAAKELLIYLREMQRQDYAVCAWNGLGFDLQWIGYCANNMVLAAQIAFDSYDPMFQFFNQRGFPVSLAKVGEAMGVEQTKLMSGADAPREWRAGNYRRVMDYVIGDSQITNEIVSRIIDNKAITWITRKGTVGLEQIPKLKTVKEVLCDPEPDQSWMDEPLLRSKFIEWIPEEMLPLERTVNHEHKTV